MPEPNTVLHQPTRLQIILLLHRNGTMKFADLREALDLTAGNLQSHLATLLDAGYVESRRRLGMRRFESHYFMSENGRTALHAHFAWLKEILHKFTIE